MAKSVQDICISWLVQRFTVFGGGEAVRLELELQSLNWAHLGFWFLICSGLTGMTRMLGV